MSWREVLKQILIGGFALLSSSCSSSGSSGSAVATNESSAEEFFELLRFTRVSERPRTPAEMLTDAQGIVRATFNNVDDGRTIDYATGASNPLQTAVFELNIVRSLKGLETEGFAYMEFLRGGIEVEDIRELMPRDLSMLVFLREATGWDPPTYRIENSGRGHPSGTTLMTYLGQEGLLTENGGLLYPLADDPDAEVFDESRLTSLDELETELSGMLGVR